MLTPAELHQMMSKGCGMPGCNCQEGPMALHARCHIKSPTFTFYNPAEMRLQVICATCRTLVVEVDMSGAVRLETQ